MKALRVKKREAGAASLEVAFLLPVLLALVLVFFEVGRVQWHFAAIDHALLQSRRDAQIRQVTSASELKALFSDRFMFYLPEHAKNARIQAETYQGIDEWLVVTSPDPESEPQGLLAGVITLTVTVPLTPLAIPLFNDKFEAYLYQQSITLIPEKKFVTE